MDASLLREFNADGHYYTAYPSLNHWTEDFGHHQYENKLRSFTDSRTPTHLYLHIPFCAKLCSYCICNIVITNNREKIQTFLDHLLLEIDLLKPYHPNIREIHLGGGTPSHLDRGQFSQLCSKLNELVDVSTLDEFAMEIDPRTVKPGDLEHYASHGVTRISFGVQDFDPNVQKAINREQPYEMVSALMEDRHLFKGVNFDLLYGLPLQTQSTISDTLNKVKSLAPDRITVLKYCHAPELRKHMKLIKEEDLPPKSDLQEMFVEITHSLIDEKYEWIGLDHFARKNDSLAQAAQRGGVGRNFNGFTPGRVKDLIGLGPTATGAFGTTYSQAQYTLKQYYEAVRKREFPILRGYKLTKDDAIRRDVIFALLCNQRVDFNDIGARHEIDAFGYFSKELPLLESDLAVMERGILNVTAYGRVLLRNICRLFDVMDLEKKHFRIAQHSMT